MDYPSLNWAPLARRAVLSHAGLCTELRLEQSPGVACTGPPHLRPAARPPRSAVSLAHTGDSPEASVDPGPVPTASTHSPSIYPLRSCCTSAINTTSVTLGCLITGYSPEPVTVTWDTGSLDRSILTFPSVQNSESSLYTTTSQVTVSGEWSKQKFTCSVAHIAYSGSTKTKVVTGCTRNFTDPSVKLFYSSCDPRGDTHTTIQLRCHISGYTPGKIKVAWLLDGREDANLIPQMGPESLEGKLASTYSELNITQGQWVSQITYTCQVTYHGITYENHARRCTAESEPRGVSAYLSPPTPLDLYVKKSPKITCLVVDLASAEDVTVTWSRENKDGVHPDPPITKTQFNGTVTVTSTLPVDASDWIEGETYYCTVAHPHLPKEIRRSISKGTGKRMLPEVYVLLPPQEELTTKDALTLTCLIQNFFPEDISVRWLRNGALLPADQHSTTRPHKVRGSVAAFFVYSHLVVKRADWEPKSNFTCQVVHEALSGSRTLEKSVPVDLELALEDLCAEEAEGEELEAMRTGLLTFIALFLLSASYGATVTLCKVKWVLAAFLREQPQASRSYTNVTQPGLPPRV